MKVLKANSIILGTYLPENYGYTANEFLQMNVCQPNSQTTLSNFNSLKPVIKKRQFNAVFTVFQNGFLHVFVCNF